MHVWRKTVTTTQEIPAGYTLGDAESGTAFSVPNAGSQNYVTMQYGPSITVNDAGGVSLTSVTGSIEFKQYSDVSAIYDIRNNFVKAIPNGSSNSAFDGVIFVPNDCSFKNAAGIVTFGKFYRVNAYPLTPAGTTTTYPVSTNPNAYQEGDDAKAAGYTLGEVVTGDFILGQDNAADAYLFYKASSPTVSDDGTIEFDKNQYIQIWYTENWTASTLQAAIRGQFLQRGNSMNVPSSYVPTGTIYIPNDAIVTRSNDNYIVSKYQPVTGYAAIPAGTTIEYLGKLGDKASVQVVSYVGTGTYGESNPVNITANFRMKFLAIFDMNQNANPPGTKDAPHAFIVEKMETTYRNYWGYELVRGSYGKRSVDGKTVSFYGSSSGSQANSSGYWYLAVAIG